MPDDRLVPVLHQDAAPAAANGEQAGGILAELAGAAAEIDRAEVFLFK